MAGCRSNQKPRDNRWEEVDVCRERGGTIRAFRPKVGAVFHDLTVVSPGVGIKSMSLCRCSCGEEILVQTRAIFREKTKRCFACGKKHAGAKNAERRGHREIIGDPVLLSLWGHRYTGMVSRCYDENHKAFPNYGGRGVGVFVGWLDDRREFFRYAKTLTSWDQLGLDFDRIDNDGHYCPGNVRLVERKINSRNKRTNTLLSCFGETMPVSEFHERFCPGWRSVNSIFHHLNHGKSPEEIVERYRRHSSCL